MAHQEHDTSHHQPTIGASQIGAAIAGLTEVRRVACTKPSAVGCVFAPSNPRVGDLSPADYAELLEEL